MRSAQHDPHPCTEFYGMEQKKKSRQDDVGAADAAPSFPPMPFGRPAACLGTRLETKSKPSMFVVLSPTLGSCLEQGSKRPSKHGTTEEDQVTGRSEKAREGATKKNKDEGGQRPERGQINALLTRTLTPPPFPSSIPRPVFLGWRLAVVVQK